MSDVPGLFGFVLIIGGIGSVTIGGAVSMAAAAGAYMSRSLPTGIIATTITGIQTMFITTLTVVSFRQGDGGPWFLLVNLALTLAAVGWILGFWIRRRRGHKRLAGGSAAE